MKTLEDLRQIILDLSADEVDDPEEIMNDLACDGDEYIAAIDKAIAICGNYSAVP